MDHYFIRAGNYWLKLSFRWLCLWLIFSLLSGVLFAVAPVQKVAAADICSTTGGEDWSLPSTWSCGHVPLRDDDVFIKNALSISAGGHTAFAHSITGNSGMLSVHGELDIYGDITLNDNSPLESTDGKVVLAGGNQTITISPKGAFAAFHDLTMDVAIIKAENLGISPPFNLNVSNLDALHSIFVSGQLTIRGGTAPAEYINLNKSGSSGSLQWYLSTGISVITDVDYVNVSDANNDGKMIEFYHGSVNNSTGWAMKTPPMTTSADLTSSLTPSHFGQTVTFTTTITPDLATGWVDFKDDNNILCTARPVKAGIATCDFSGLEVRTHLITASFFGIDIYNNSSSSSLSQDVLAALSSDAALSELLLSQGTLDPFFTPGTTPYAATVAYDVNSITVTATPNDSYAHASISPGSQVTLVDGFNLITVTVTAEDGITTQNYTITVTREVQPSSDAALISLVVEHGTDLIGLDPVFNLEILLYTAHVVNGVTSVTLTPTTRENHATVAMTDGSSIPVYNPVDLTTGLNTILVIVTAQDGVTKQTYQIDLTRELPLSDDATLLSLTLSSGVLNPKFSPDQVNYHVSVTNAVNSVSVSAVPNEEHASISIDLPSPVSLSVGPNVIKVTVTAQDGENHKDYTISVMRDAPVSNDANLASLEVDDGSSLVALNPEFDTGTLFYTASVENNVTGVTVKPTTQESHATYVMMVNLCPLPTQTVPLEPGENIILVMVVAQDGLSPKTYQITLTRALPLSNDAALNALSISHGTLDPVFSSGMTHYTAEVNNDIASVLITAIPEENHATVAITGYLIKPLTNQVALNVGPNTFLVVVTAQDGVTKQTYRIDLTRAAPLSNDAALKSVSLSCGSITPDFSAEITNYALNVLYDILSVSVTPSANESQAVVTVNDILIPSGKASAPIALWVGQNIINVTVTAQDGITTRTYTILVVRAKADAMLEFARQPVGFLHYGQTFTVTVALHNPGGVIIEAALALLDEMHEVGTGATNEDGSLTFSIDHLSVGEHSISAVFAGDSQNNPVTSATISLTVAKDDTLLEIASDLSKASVPWLGYGVVISLAPVYGMGTPSGTVVVREGTASCTIHLESATLCQLISTGGGNKLITADYSGDDNYYGTSASASHPVLFAAFLPVVY